MLVTRKVNNNVAVCIDASGRELIATGKGIGFPKMPYELTDLDKIERTYYDMNTKFLPLLKDLPEEVFNFTAKLMDEIRPRLPYETSANIVLTLADHLAFALERARKNIYIQMPSVYELEQNYPLEVRIGRYIVSSVEREFHVSLPRGEVQGAAIHFINARNVLFDQTVSPEDEIEQKYDEILEQTTQIIEWEMEIRVSRDSFSYARFATHLQYLFKRVFKNQHIDSDNLQMYCSMRGEYPQVSRCVDRIAEYYRGTWHVELTEEEKLYLILHINRVCAKDA